MTTGALQSDLSPHSIDLNDGTRISVRAVGPTAFHVRVGGALVDESPLVRYRILRENSCPAEIEDTGTEVYVRTGQASVRVSRNGTLALSDANDEIVLETAAPVSEHPRFALRREEQLFGLGDVGRDRIARRGRTIDMWVRNVKSYVPIPFLWSTENWGFLLNTTHRHMFDLGNSDPDSWTLSGDASYGDFFLFVGESPADLLNSYTAIAGKPTLLPQWAYGLTFVENVNANARDVLDTLLKFREYRIPCDGIGLEPTWMQNWYDYSTEKTWHNERYFIPRYMTGADADTFPGTVARLKFRLSLWLCCDYDLSYAEEALVIQTEDDSENDGITRVEHDTALLSAVRADTITKPDEPWFEHLKKFVDDGAAAFKLDGANQVLEHPDRLWANGMTDRQMHNLYPVLLGKQMQQGFAEYTGRRPLIYTAGGYTGIQQFAATWAGDTGGGEQPLVSMLNHGMSGHSNTSCDMHIFTKEGIHFGFLQPWSQLCSWNYYRHPWFLEPELLDIVRDYAVLRYRLLPYIYSAAHVAADTGMPILRAMPLAYPDDVAGHHLLNQYMLGDSLLVTAFTDTVHLPPGDWYDYWTGEVHTGPDDIRIEYPANRGGVLLVKVGSVLPTWDAVSNTSDADRAHLGLEVFAGASGTTTVYEDDGTSLQHMSGARASTTVTFDGRDLRISPLSGHYAGMPTERRYTVTVRGLTRPIDHAIIDGERVRLEFNNGVAQIDVPARSTGEAIRIQLVS